MLLETAQGRCSGTLDTCTVTLLNHSTLHASRHLFLSSFDRNVRRRAFSSRVLQHGANCQLPQVFFLLQACNFAGHSKTVWPSGLRQWLKAPFRKGVGSNPTAVIFAAWGFPVCPRSYLIIKLQVQTQHDNTILAAWSATVPPNAREPKK